MARTESDIARTLLRWYDKHRRVLPWRAGSGETPDPYRVWLSEIMLQQTTVGAVAPYYAKFLARWPSVRALARADRDDVLAAWAGLGYYARARNLHACAVKIADEFGGRFPDDEATLLTLPGIGRYTAAAIAAIAFGKKATPVDDNIERVMARLFAVAAPLPAAKAELARLAETLTPPRRAGDFAQALMDLGATICKPKAPDCPDCPLASSCLGKAQGLAESLPRKPKKSPKPKRYAVAFVILTKDLKILIRKRNEKGLLGGMKEIPSTPWTDTAWSHEGALAHAPIPGAWESVPGKINHIFTHFEFDINVMVKSVDQKSQADGAWVPIKDLDRQALPSVMSKIIRHGLAGLGLKAMTRLISRAGADRR